MTTINKNFCALLCGFAVYVFSVSGAYAACSGNDIEIDKINGKRYGCKCNDRYNRTDYASGSGINGGFKIFDSFPMMKYCYSAADDRWKGNGTTMCSGFSYSNYDSATMEPVAYRKNDKDGNGCWKWKCKSGYGFIVDQQTGKVDNRKCEPIASNEIVDPTTGVKSEMCDSISTINNEYYTSPANALIAGKCFKVCESPKEQSNIVISDDTEFTIKLQ